MNVVIVFDGPPGATSGRFVEVEEANTRAGVDVGQWYEDPHNPGWWLLALELKQPTCGCGACIPHLSDCAVHNAPGLDEGPCTCPTGQPGGVL